jgi:hypothetical protein
MKPTQQTLATAGFDIQRNVLDAMSFAHMDQVALPWRS